MEDDESSTQDREDRTKDVSGTTAPSIGPNTVIEHERPEERLARHEQSDIDAMGLEKRRQVVGGSYGASFAKQATLYGSALAVTILIVIGLILLTNELDAPPEEYEDRAPWSQPAAEQIPPSKLL